MMSRAVMTFNRRSQAVNSPEMPVQWTVTMEVSDYGQLSRFHRVLRAFGSAVNEQLEAPRLIQTTYDADVNPETAHQSIFCRLTWSPSLRKNRRNENLTSQRAVMLRIHVPGSKCRESFARSIKSGESCSCPLLAASSIIHIELICAWKMMLSAR